MGGIGSGPQKSPASLIKEAKENDAKNLPDYFTKLSEMALNGDREALFYMINRHMGAPKQTQDVQLKAVKSFSEDDYELIVAPSQREKQLLKQWQEPVIIEDMEVDDGRNE